MPMYFQFLQKTTGEHLKLPQVDDLMCEIMDYPSNAERFCPWYDLTIMTGAGFLARNGDSEILDEAALKEYLDNREHPIEDDVKELMLKFLVQDFTFSAWHGR